jgi:signal transduction histidine kinase
VKKSFITGIIALLTLSLVGIIVLQGLWISNAWQAKQEDFQRGVTEAIGRVVQQLEKKEALSFINRYSMSTQQDFFYMQQNALHITASGSKDSFFLFHNFQSITSRGYANKSNPDKHVTDNWIIPGDGKSQFAGKDSAFFTIPGEKSDSFPTGTIDKRMRMKASQWNDIIYQMVMEWSNVQLPLEQRISPADLHLLIKQELNKKGINLPFQFAVMTGMQDSISNIKSSSFNTSMVPVSFRTQLFPNDIFSSPYQLLIHFNDMRPYFIKSLWWMLLLSAVFLLLIIATFASAIYVILKQKKVSEIKTDFINNMTHELKTPIATISIALDAINNPRVLENKDRIRYYSNIIGNENKRMHAHVENILQMALVDKENFELNEQLLDLHDLIMRVADQVYFQVEKRNGSLDLQLDAENAYVVADEIHLTNVIYNLLDNANKYSPESPEIVVKTENVPNGINIIVEDKGIGMTAETQRNIFEKFYREEIGNVHNVKGFGLGLAYVKSIVKKHGGDIRVQSEKGKGSRFEVFLPFGHHKEIRNNSEVMEKE